MSSGRDHPFGGTHKGKWIRQTLNDDGGKVDIEMDNVTGDSNTLFLYYLYTIGDSSLWKAKNESSAHQNNNSDKQYLGVNSR